MPNWPELIGKNIEEAKNFILSENPDFNVEVLPVNSPTTRDLRPNRVRIFVDQ